MSQHQLPARPPEPPTMQRRIALDRVQVIGFPLLLVLPVLALLGVFGPRDERATVRSADIELSVHWPTRTRHERIHDIDVVVRNVSARVMDTVTVTLDTTYLAGFSAVGVTPGAEHAWEVKLADVQPGESRHVVVEIDAQRYGRREGPVMASAGGPDTARVVIDTFIFP